MVSDGRMYVILFLSFSILVYYLFKLAKYIGYLENRNMKLESFSSVLNEIKDKSYIISVHNTFKVCKRCYAQDKQGFIHENKRFRFRVNESRVWVNELPSYFYCTNCKYKSLTLRRLNKHSEIKIKNEY